MNLPRPHAFTYPAQPLVLVVEGEELLRPYAADLLEAHGFAVLKAENADEALKVLEQRNDVRLLFTDIQMPGALDGMDGARFTPVGPASCWLSLLANRRPSARRFPMTADSSAKPYRASELLGQVDNLIEKT